MEKIDAAKSGHGITKVAIVGPESTGKTALAGELAKYFNAKWVPEYARGYIDQLGRSYQELDLLKIAQGQLELEDRYLTNSGGLLICDTNLLVIKIWSEFKYGRCDPFILDQLIQRNYELYLLTGIDVVWKEDPQREHPHQRQQLYDIYREELVNYKFNFVEISGDEDERLNQSVQAIKKVY